MFAGCKSDRKLAHPLLTGILVDITTVNHVVLVKKIQAKDNLS